MIIKKKSSHPTISLVFGEAQQVSPSQTAAEKLPQILRKASPISSSLILRDQLEESEMPPAHSDQPSSELANTQKTEQVSTTDAQESLPLAVEGIYYSFMSLFSHF